MDTTNTSTQSEGLRMRLNVSTWVLIEVTTFFLNIDQRFLKINLNFKMMPGDIF